MTLLSRPYRPEDHSPDAFLGRRLVLPELEGHPIRDRLERPLAGVDDLLLFADQAAWFGPSYDRKLAPPHWGVWQARQLEGAFWRLQDALSATPRLPHAFGPAVRTPVDGHGPPTAVGWYLDSYSTGGTSCLRHMAVEFLRPHRGDDDFVDVPRETEWPWVDPEEELTYSRGLKARAMFWQPLDLASVAEALHAWGGTRFGNGVPDKPPRRFRMPVLAAVGHDPARAFEGTFGPIAGAAFRAARLAERLPDRSRGSCAPPRV